MRESKMLPRKPLPATKKPLQPPAKSNRVPAKQASPDHTEVPISTTPVPQASLSSQPRVPRTTKTPTSAIERRQLTSKLDDSELSTSSISYDVMNTSFHRTFPVTAALEINVEKFLIASSTSDRELEPTGSLSISQVEALQESHWQAYHYLNEKKVRPATVRSKWWCTEGPNVSLVSDFVDRIDASTRSSTCRGPIRLAARADAVEVIAQLYHALTHFLELQLAVDDMRKCDHT